MFVIKLYYRSECIAEGVAQMTSKEPQFLVHETVLCLTFCNALVSCCTLKKEGEKEKEELIHDANR